MIKLIPQTHHELLKDIRNVGCFFRSAQAIAEIEAGKTLSVFHINTMWLWAKSKGIIDEKNCMQCSAPIANKTLEVLGVRNKKFVEIATSKKGLQTFYKSVPTMQRKPKYFIRKILNQFNGTHFLVVDDKGKTIFDPNSSIIEKKEIYTICYYVKTI